jgi:uncharacterized protein YybS (DUF2232 family)
MIIVVAGVMVLLFHAEGGFYYIYEFGILNAFLLMLLSRESDLIHVIFRSSVFAYLTVVIVVGSLAVIYDVNVHEAISFMIDSSIDRIMEMYENVELPADQAKALTDMYESLKALFKKTYPALLFVGFELVATLNLLVINRFFLDDKKKFDTEKLLSWSPNERWVFGLIAFGFLYFVKIELVNFIALNGIIVFLALYFFSGFAIMNHFFKAKKTSAFMQGIIYFLLVLISEFKFIIIAVGLFDIWFDFRKIKHKKPKIT